MEGGVEPHIVKAPKHKGIFVKSDALLEEVGWLVLRSTAFTLGESPQDQSGHEGEKKNLHPSDTLPFELSDRSVQWVPSR